MSNEQMWDKIERYEDPAGLVTKFVFTKSDAIVETVLYRYPTYDERTVICHSVMSGCPMGCRFCGTGDYFVRNLTSEEIISQVEYALAQTGIDPNTMKRLQIMSMSMGEPALCKNLEAAYDNFHAQWPKAALLISSAGPDVNYTWIVNVAKRIPTVGLQFSVHESTNEARNALIPFEHKLNLEQIATVGKRFYRETGRSPFFNYCAHDKNTSQADADRLALLFDPLVWCATVSVICEQNDGMPASNDYQKSLAVDFAEKLVNNSFDVRVFDPSGQDSVGGGCGQLWFVQKWMREHPDLTRPSCGNGLTKMHTPIIPIFPIHTQH
jgi:23S rRNA (adenine2503-C2)-methyltransferase